MRSTPENLEVLHEDNHIIIVNKKSGDIVQGDKTGDRPLSEIVKEYIKKKYNKPGNVFLGVVHRLDRPTSGAVIFARTSKALARLNDQLKNKKIKKTYWAIIKGDAPSQASLIHYLKKNPKNNKSTAFEKEIEGSKKAILHYKNIGRSDKYSLLEIDLETGRHHQIRAQLSKMGYPIKGDLKYGFPRSNPDKGISLHARKLSFIHPVSREKMEIKAPLPSGDLWKHFKTDD
jgi:23S rRNA pseudouridine1911/1915/1917 synthase